MSISTWFHKLLGRGKQLLYSLYGNPAINQTKHIDQSLTIDRLVQLKDLNQERYLEMEDQLDMAIYETMEEAKNNAA